MTRKGNCFFLFFLIQFLFVNYALAGEYADFNETYPYESEQYLTCNFPTLEKNSVYSNYQYTGNNFTFNLFDISSGVCQRFKVMQYLDSGSYPYQYAMGINKSSEGTEFPFVAVVEFDEPISLLNITQISYQQNFGKEGCTHITFMTSDYDCRLTLYACSSLYSGTNQSGEIWCNDKPFFSGDNLDMGEFSCQLSNTLGGVHTINKTLASCGFTQEEFNNMTDIKYMLISLAGNVIAASYNRSIDNFALNNVFYGENMLPEFNTSVFVRQECLNATLEDIDTYVTVNINISANDPENDTIYYSYNFITSGMINKTIRFEKGRGFFIGNIMLYSDWQPDYSYLDDSYYQNGQTCRYDSDNWTQNIATVVPSIFPELKQHHVLRLDGHFNICEDKTWYYEIPNSFDLLYIAELLGFDGFVFKKATGGSISSDDVERFNLSFYSNDFLEIARILFEHNWTTKNTTVYEWNGSIKTKKLSIQTRTPTLDSGRFVFTVTNLKVNNGTYYFTLFDPLNDNNPVTASMTKIYDYPVKYIAYHLGPDNRMELDQFMYRTEKLERVWTANNTYTFDMNWAGQTYMTVFVSDSMHYPNEYAFDRVLIEVKDCRYYFPAIYGEFAHAKFLKQGRIDKYIKWLFGRPIKNFLVELNIDTKAEVGLWILFLLLLGYVFWSSHKDFNFAMLTAACGTGGIAYLLDYPTVFISMLVLFVLALTSYVVKLFIK